MNQDPTNPPIWCSTITKKRVEGWTDAEIEALFSDLDDAVMHIVQDHEQRRGQ